MKMQTLMSVLSAYCIMIIHAILSRTDTDYIKLVFIPLFSLCMAYILPLTFILEQWVQGGPGKNSKKSWRA